MTTTSLSKLRPQKLCKNHFLKQANFMQNFVQSHAKESQIELSPEFLKHRRAAPRTEL